MEVEFTNTVEDAIAFNQYHADHPPSAHRVPRQTVLLGLAALFGIISTLSILYATYSDDVLAAMTVPCFFLVLSLGFLSLHVLRHQLIAIRVRRVFRQDHNAKYLEITQRLSVTPEALTQASELATGTYQWTAVEKIVVTDDHAFIYTTTWTAAILPKRAFANPEDFKSFVDIARRYQEAAVPR
jgi:hypothetical protein